MEQPMMTSLPPPFQAARVSEHGDNNTAFGYAWKQIEVGMKQHMQLRTLIYVCSYHSLSQMKAYRHAIEVTARNGYCRANNWLPSANGQDKVISTAKGYSCSHFPDSKG